jgi:hypothetical protein
VVGVLRVDEHDAAVGESDERRAEVARPSADGHRQEVDLVRGEPPVGQQHDRLLPLGLAVDDRDERHAVHDAADQLDDRPGRPLEQVRQADEQPGVVFKIGRRARRHPNRAHAAKLQSASENRVPQAGETQGTEVVTAAATLSFLTGVDSERSRPHPGKDVYA